MSNPPNAAKPDLDLFTNTVRAFLRDHLPDDLRSVARTNVLPQREHVERWHGILHAHGWSAPGWPKCYGGTGWTLMEQAVFLRECAMADAPRFDNLGLTTIGPAIIQHGNAAQHQRFLPRIASFQDYWAQGFSEPGAGSDLASLTTSARLDGDHYIVRGSKTWTSHAHWANWILVLVRTDPAAARRQDGLSVLLVQRDLPGLTVRPIRYMNGSILHNEVFFDDVRVPLDCLLGRPGDGWTIARDMLVQERLFLARVPECERDLAHLGALGERRNADGLPLRDEPWFQRSHSELCMRFDGYAFAWWTAVARAERGEDAGLSSSVLRLMGTAMLQDIHQAQLECVAEAGLGVDPAGIQGDPFAQPRHAHHEENIHLHHFRYRGITLGAGTSEVQRGIVSRSLMQGGQVPLPTPDPNLVPLAEAASAFSRQQYTLVRRRSTIEGDGFSLPAWGGLADLGMLGALVPDECGGSALGMQALAAMSIALGEALIIEPWYWAASIAGALARHDAEAELVRGIVAGRRIPAFAAVGHGMRGDPYQFRAAATGVPGGWSLDARLSPVFAGTHAHDLLIPVSLAGRSSALLRVDANASSVQRTAYRTYDGRACAEVTLMKHGFTESDLLLVGEGADVCIWDILDSACLAEMAETLGAMRRALEITMDYLGTRRQFGRSLSEFQVLQHRLADDYVHLFQLHAFVMAAAQALGERRADTTLRMAAAKWAAGKFGRIVAHDVLQMHGAIGLQDETPISHYARRILAGGAVLGDMHIQLDRYIMARQTGQTAAVWLSRIATEVAA
jgi:acyl-CoA dehydrogenase